MRYAICLLLAATALGGCGGDDGDGGGAKDEFIRQGDAICKRVNSHIDEINSQAQSVTGSQNAKFAALVPIFRRAVKLQDDAIEEFRALDPPADDTDVIDEYLDAAEQQRTALDQLANAAARRDPQAFSALTQRLNSLSERRRALARGYGFHECGSNAES